MKMKRIIKSLFVFSLFFLLVFKVDAQEEYLNQGYYIKSYDVNIDVKRDNSYDITETITAYFNEERHGIFRKIPFQNNVVRNDGSSYQNKVKISNVKVNEKYTTYTENGNYVVKIGSAYKTLTGEKTYKISYNYKIGNDKTNDFDEFYFNIIGTEWDTYINNVTFKINFPKEIDKEKIGFSVGKYGSVGYEDVTYEVEGNTIIGSYNKGLGPYQGINIREELEEGYYDEIQSPINVFTYLLYSIPIISLFISLFMWNKYGKDEEVIETVEFYPPEGMNSLDVAFNYKGSASSKDVTSLLIYLANKGYLKIEETEKKGLIGKSKGFTIYKLKEYDGDNEQEKKFMNGLFKHSSIKVDDEHPYEGVTKEDLYDSFYTTMNSIISKTNSSKNKHKIFEKNGGKTFLSIVMALVSLAIIVWLPIKDEVDAFEIFMLTFGIIIFMSVWTIGMIFGIMSISKKSVRLIALSIVIGISLFFFGTIFFGTGAVDNFKDYYMDYPIYFIGLMIGLVSVVGTSVFAFLMKKRTQYGTEILGKLRGFKNFLETAEKEKLEALVEENPTYFYDVLPYTYAFGISNKWVKKFEDMNLKSPDWYVGTGTFDMNSFDHFMSSTMTSAVSAMSSSPSSDGGGGFSGGGFSGGGSGGGGGGSW